MDSPRPNNRSRAKECISVLASTLEKLIEEAEKREAKRTESSDQRLESVQSQIAGPQSSSLRPDNVDEVCGKDDEDYIKCATDRQITPVASSTPIQQQVISSSAKKPAFKVSYYTTIKQDENGRFSKIYTIRKFTPYESRAQQLPSSIDQGGIRSVGRPVGLDIPGGPIPGQSLFSASRRPLPRPVFESSSSLSGTFEDKGKSLRRLMGAPMFQRRQGDTLQGNGMPSTESVRFRTLRGRDEALQDNRMPSTDSVRFRTLRRRDESLKESRMPSTESVQFRTLRRRDDTAQENRMPSNDSIRFRTLRRKEETLQESETPSNESVRFRTLKGVPSFENIGAPQYTSTPVRQSNRPVSPRSFDFSGEISPPLRTSTPKARPFVRQSGLTTPPGRFQTLRIAVHGDKNQQIGQVEEREFENDPENASFKFSRRVRFLPDSNPFENFQEHAENFGGDRNLSLPPQLQESPNDEHSCAYPDRLRRQLSCPAIPNSSPAEAEISDVLPTASNVVSERQAHETLNELIDVNLKGFEKIVKSLQQKTAFECNKEALPDDPKLLIDILISSLQDTENNLNDLRHGMQNILSEMANVIAERAKQRLPELVQLAEEVNNPKCPLNPGPYVPSDSGPLGTSSQLKVEASNENQEDLNKTKSSIDQANKGSGSSIMSGSNKKKFFRTRVRDLEK